MNHVVLEGVLPTPVSIMVVAARFNEFIVDKLVEGAVRSLQRNGVDSGSITLVNVPGAFEIPLVVRAALERGDCDGVVAVGAVIRGATPHFDYVAGECSKGIMQMALKYGKPVGNGVLTVDTIEQAIERAGTKAGNKGAEAAVAMLETLGVLHALDPST